VAAAPQRNLDPLGECHYCFADEAGLCSAISKAMSL